MSEKVDVLKPKTDLRFLETGDMVCFFENDRAGYVFSQVSGFVTPALLRFGPSLLAERPSHLWKSAQTQSWTTPSCRTSWFALVSRGCGAVLTLQSQCGVFQILPSQKFKAAKEFSRALDRIKDKYV